MQNKLRETIKHGATLRDMKPEDEIALIAEQVDDIMAEIRRVDKGYHSMNDDEQKQSQGIVWRILADSFIVATGSKVGYKVTAVKKNIKRAEYLNKVYDSYAGSESQQERQILSDQITRINSETASYEAELKKDILTYIVDRMLKELIQ